MATTPFDPQPFGGLDHFCPNFVCPEHVEKKPFNGARQICPTCGATLQPITRDMLPLFTRAANERTERANLWANGRMSTDVTSSTALARSDRASRMAKRLAVAALAVAAFILIGLPLWWYLIKPGLVKGAAEFEAGITEIRDEVREELSERITCKDMDEDRTIEVTDCFRQWATEYPREFGESFKFTMQNWAKEDPEAFRAFVRDTFGRDTTIVTSGEVDVEVEAKPLPSDPNQTTQGPPQLEITIDPNKPDIDVDIERTGGDDHREQKRATAPPKREVRTAPPVTPPPPPKPKLKLGQKGCTADAECLGSLICLDNICVKNPRAPARQAVPRRDEAAPADSSHKEWPFGGVFRNLSNQ